ncbi:TetR/AcrR family transcriptional regulator [Patulibacter sp. NPDC049589]|uniref:TetR/AcrR family transcriptional regulator n=1 Tax=Patulibacter sp. NPDC049589 TaxID=3154731 RepID=UPI00341BA101
MPGEPRIRLSPTERKARIDEAATRLFAGRGYAATTVDEIAREAGVTKPMLYRHYESKRDLCVALLERYRAELVAAPLGQFDPSSDSPQDGLVPMLEAWLLHVRAHPDAARLLLRPISGDAEVEEIQRELHGRQRATQVALLREFLPELSAADAEPLGEIVRSSLTAMAMWWLDRPDVPLDVPTRALATTVRGIFAVAPQPRTER